MYFGFYREHGYSVSGMSEIKNPRYNQSMVLEFGLLFIVNQEAFILTSPSTVVNIPAEVKEF